MSVSSPSHQTLSLMLVFHNIISRSTDATAGLVSFLIDSEQTRSLRAEPLLSHVASVPLSRLSFKSPIACLSAVLSRCLEPFWHWASFGEGDIAGSNDLEGKDKFHSKVFRLAACWRCGSDGDINLYFYLWGKKKREVAFRVILQKIHFFGVMHSKVDWIDLIDWFIYGSFTSLFHLFLYIFSLRRCIWV